MCERGRTMMYWSGYVARAERGAREAALLHWRGCVIVRWRGMCKRGG